MRAAILICLVEGESVQNSPDGHGNAGGRQETERPPGMAPKRDMQGGAAKLLDATCIGIDSGTAACRSDYRFAPKIVILQFSRP